MPRLLAFARPVQCRDDRSGTSGSGLAAGGWASGHRVAGPAVTPTAAVGGAGAVGAAGRRGRPPDAWFDRGARGWRPWSRRGFDRRPRRPETRGGAVPAISGGRAPLALHRPGAERRAGSRCGSCCARLRGVRRLRPPAFHVRREDRRGRGHRAQGVHGNGRPPCARGHVACRRLPTHRRRVPPQVLRPIRQLLQPGASTVHVRRALRRCHRRRILRQTV
jgi:hypothetical protein